MDEEGDDGDMLLMCELMDVEDPVLQASAKEIVTLHEEKVNPQGHDTETRIDATDAGVISKIMSMIWM